jgi:hypothetical protein
LITSVPHISSPISYQVKLVLILWF